MPNQSKVVIYTTKVCPFCVSAKHLLKKKEIDFTEIDLSTDPDLRLEISKKTGMRTVPQILINDNCIGGCQELYALEKSGELAKLINLK